MCSEYFILIVLVMSFLYLWNGYWFAGSFCVRSLSSKPSFSVLRIQIRLSLFIFRYLVSSLFISSMADIFLLTYFRSPEFVYPTGVFLT
jgi:hypothetical protein